MTTAAIIAAGEARAAHVATMPRTQLIRRVDGMMTTEEHNDKPTGSNDGRADPVRDALAEALEEVTNGENWRSGRKFDPNSGNFDLSKQRAALALAKGEKT
jgi:hypothetical protein